MIIKNEDDGIESKPHSHPPDPRTLEKDAAIEKLKKFAGSNVAHARDLVLQACGSVQEPTVAVLPKTRNMVATVKRIQCKANLKLNPKTLDELNFDQENSTTGNGDFFVLHDSKCHAKEDGDKEKDENAERFVIFGTKKNLEIMKSCETLSMDGTFKITPPLFKQLYTIHGNRMHFM